MTGKYIDRILFTAAGATVSYLFFLNAWGNIPLACALAFIFCITLRKLILHRPIRFKCSSAQAEAELMRIASMDDSKAGEALERLIRNRYPSENFVLSPIVRHPSSGISMGDVFTQWKKHSGCERLLIAATCAADPRTIMYARELSSPRIAIIDRKQIIRIIRTKGVPETTAATPFFIRLKRIPANLTLRHAGIKNALFGCALTLIYFLNGQPLYLVMGLFSLFLFGCALQQKRCKKRLFP